MIIKIVSFNSKLKANTLYSQQKNNPQSPKTIGFTDSKTTLQ
jgi:hypothetical protein